LVNTNLLRLTALLGLAPLLIASGPTVPKWSRFEREFRSTSTYANPVQDVDFRVEFHSPSGVQRTAYGFWDGGRTWRVRLSPDETGVWTYRSFASDKANTGLHNAAGSFVCGPPRTTGTAFEVHGPIVISDDGVHLQHADGTPFFWLADTAWNGPLWSSAQDWNFYLNERVRQGFTAVQWVATQWRGAPEGDAQKRPAYSGLEKIALNLDFFRHLEERHDALIRAGMVSVPVMFWAINRGSEDQVNPGVSLPEQQAIVLGRYMAARWNADPVVWILNGDGDYRGENAPRWRTIGRGIFQEIWHAPVTLHPGAMIWAMNEFSDESWLSIAGYQSSHADSERNSRWITGGEPATYWKRDRARATLSLEAPYESPARPGQTRPPDEVTRRNHYWSVLNAPVVGVTYGATGIWSWSDGKSPAPGHGSSVPPAWNTVLDLPGAKQMTLLASFFKGMDFQRLRPAPQVLARQPGAEDVSRFISCAQTPEMDLTVIYSPVSQTISVVAAALPDVRSEWFNPRTGERTPASGRAAGDAIEFSAPGDEDWLLIAKKSK
jgi:hypothetical protein